MESLLEAQMDRLRNELAVERDARMGAERAAASSAATVLARDRHIDYLEGMVKCCEEKCEKTQATLCKTLLDLVGARTDPGQQTTSPQNQYPMPHGYQHQHQQQYHHQHQQHHHQQPAYSATHAQSVSAQTPDRLPFDSGRAPATGSSAQEGVVVNPDVGGRQPASLGGAGGERMAFGERPGGYQAGSQHWGGVPPAQGYAPRWQQ